MSCFGDAKNLSAAFICITLKRPKEAKGYEWETDTRGDGLFLLLSIHRMKYADSLETYM